MKKVLSILLALVMFLSLCACSEAAPNSATSGAENSTNPSTENATVPASDNTDPQSPTEDEETKLERYNHALMLLESSTSNYNDRCNDVKEAYEILSQLKGYKEANTVLQHITVVTDVCVRVDVQLLPPPNIFEDEQSEPPSHYFRGYDPLGRMTWCHDHEFGTLLTYAHDTDNRVAEITEINSEGKTINTTSNQYDEDGNLVSVYKDHLIGTNMNWSETITYEYLANGLLLSENTVLFDGTERTTTFSYDENGLQESPSPYLEYTYDTNGNRIEEYWHHSDYDSNRDDNQTLYTYDDFGNLIKRVTNTYDIEGKLQTTSSIEYVYENMRLISEYHYIGDVREKEIIYIFGDYYCYTPAE